MRLLIAAFIAQLIALGLAYSFAWSYAVLLLIFSCMITVSMMVAEYERQRSSP
jgi:hypothetical protein